MTFGFVDILTIFLVTVGPLKALIVFGALTAKAEPDFRRQVATRTVTVATIVTLVFVVAGELFLQVFHISLPALKIAGGIILLLFALDMIMGGGHAADDDKPKAASLDIAVFPLAMPMMATVAGLLLTALAVQLVILGLRDLGVIGAATAAAAH